jgi:DNA replication protein DnaC
MSKRKLVPCRNEPCPYKARVPVIELFGQTFTMLCERCVADMEEDERLKERMALVALYMGRTHAGARLREWSLATYPRDEPENRKALTAAQSWLGRYRNGEREDLILFGSVGSGKTGLAWGIVRALIEVDLVEADLVNFRDLLLEIRAGFDERHRGVDITQRMKRLPVLCVDDVGAERVTDWSREELAGLLEARYEWKRPTIWTSNYSLGDLARRIGHDDLVIGQRIVSRMSDVAVQVRLSTKDRRL